jgi:hypothetical protein
MKGRVAAVLALAAVVSLALVADLHSQAKKDPKTGLYRIEGSVLSIDTDKSVITVKQAGQRNVTWSVAYTKDTAVTHRNEGTKIDDVKVGRQVICLGKIDDPEKAKTHLTAVRIDVRTK